jgi:hypothetical protein
MTNIYAAEEDMLLSKWYKQIRHGFGEWPCGCAGMVHGQTDLRLEIMKYILNVINILVYINSASNNTSSASVMLVV